MRLSTLALAHIARRPGKAVVLLLGLGVGVATVVGVLAVAWTMERAVNEQLRASGLRAVISPANREWTFTYAGLPVGPGVNYQAAELPPDTPARLAEAGGTDVVAPKLLALTPGPRGDDVLAVGVEWGPERELRPYWRVQGAYPGDSSEVVVGSHLAALWGIRPGGKVLLFGRACLVSGVLDETGQEEDGLVFFSLAELRGLTGRPEAVTFVEVRVPGDSSEQVAWLARAARLLPDAEVTPVRSVEQARLGLLERVKALAPLVALVATLGGALLVGATELAAARERTREVGILRALGYREAHVLRVFLAEVVILGTGAAWVGYGAGLAAARFLLPLLDPASGAVGWYPRLGLAAWAGSIVVTVAAGYFPARQAARTDPAEALRYF